MTKDQTIDAIERAEKQASRIADVMANDKSEYIMFLGRSINALMREISWAVADLRGLATCTDDDKEEQE